jgi:hypothetical protein
MPLEFLSDNPTVPLLFVGTVVAVISLRSQRHLARAKNTLDFDKEFREHELQNLRTAIRLIRMTSPDARERLGRLDLPNDETVTLTRALNVWESVAIGIRNGIYSERLLRDAYGTTIAWFFEHSRPFVGQRRQINARYYENFCWLGERWSRARSAYVPGTSRKRRGRAAVSSGNRILRIPILEDVTRRAVRP